MRGYCRSWRMSYEPMALAAGYASITVGTLATRGEPWTDENVLNFNIKPTVIEEMRIDNCKMKTAK